MLRVEKNWFIDEHGRTILLRGVNLSGTAKVPMIPNGATHFKKDFHDHHEVSFVGRPFPINEATEHLQRIKHWGFNTLRLVVTWEAIEHKNPKEYDKEYLDYFQELLKITEEYKFFIIIDPHQDAWSRLSGGDGAPGWTFEKVGLDFTKFDQSEAALVMQHRFDPNNLKAYDPMSWSQNLVRFANGTMWTLFFGGEDLAPSCTIEGISAQQYLQKHFFGAFKELAKYVKDNPYVIGFSTLNEPNQGWIGHLIDGSTIDISEILGYAFTPFDAMLTGSGIPRIVPFRAIKRFGIKEIRKDELNPNSISCWLNRREDIWRKEGVWGLDEEGNPTILRNDHFYQKNGRKIHFLRDYMSPFVSGFSTVIREVIPETNIFFGPPTDILMKKETLDIELPANVILEAHWYDVATIGMKRLMAKANFDMRTGKTVIGEGNVRKMFSQQLQDIKKTSTMSLGEKPVLIAEVGLCFDLDKKKAYETWKTDPDKAWKTHVKALSMYYNAIDENILSSIHWNYTPDNTNIFGDLWNLEDFSIFSLDQQTNPENLDSGGRAITGFCRPHFRYIAGTPLKMHFNPENLLFQLTYEADSSIKAPTVLYVPTIHYSSGFVIDISSGYEEKSKDPQVVLVRSTQDGPQTISVRPRS